MGLLDTSLQIGRSAIMAHSLAMDVVGNNLANAGTEGYARQVADLRSAQGIRTVQGPYLGLGVNAEHIRRLSDFYLEQRLRDARSQAESLRTQDQMFQRLEGAFNELTDNDLSTMVNEFFTALNTLQSAPEDRSVRRAVVESAVTLTETVRLLRDKLDDLRRSLDSELAGGVTTINEIAAQVAQINIEISRLEGGGTNTATALRDRRDLLLGQLADVMGVRVVETESGMVNVFAGADPLVLGSRAYALDTRTRVDNGVAVTDVVFAADGRPAVLKSGSMQGIVAARDTGVMEFVQALDTWTGAFIDGFNRIYASGQGLDSYSSVTGANGVSDPLAALNKAGLAFAPVTGTFEINVRNSNSGETTTFRIHVDLDGIGADTSLTSLAEAINAEIGAVFGSVSASVGPGNTLRINSASPELTFSFANDTSGVLACLGVNTFFTGGGSSDFRVNALVVANPGLIAAGLSNLPGDNSNVSRLIAFQRAPSQALSGASIDTYYQGIVSTLGVRGAGARDRHLGAQAIRAAVESQREAVSGVSLDEEAVKLIRYQSGYAAAARFISTVDELIKVLLNM